MKLAIMQPYFLPYIGYFQLINAVDEFVIYDNIQYTKKGWINRNRILVNNQDQYISLPIKKDSDYLNVNQRILTDDFKKEKIKILNKLKGCYFKAPYYNDIIKLLKDILDCSSQNLFEYIYNSILKIVEYISIDTKILLSSSLDCNIEEYKAEKKVLIICKTLNASQYINPIGGVELYSREYFKLNGIDLKFLQTEKIVYPQFKNEFVPNLSIIDVLMFNSKEEINLMLNKYTLI